MADMRLHPEGSGMPVRDGDPRDAGTGRAATGDPVASRETGTRIEDGGDGASFWAGAFRASLHPFVTGLERIHRLGAGEDRRSGGKTIAIAKPSARPAMEPGTAGRPGRAAGGRSADGEDGMRAARTGAPLPSASTG
jgi:hypothetical protein